MDLKWPLPAIPIVVNNTLKWIDWCTTLCWKLGWRDRRKKEGTIRHKGEDITIVDLPGIYSLSPFTLEERISRQYILEDMPDMIINIVDASALERNLFLTFQLMELGRPVIIALNMMDEAEKRGIKIDVEGLSEALGLPIVPIVARKEKGLDALMDMVLDQVHSGAKLESKPIRYSEDLEQMIQGAEHVINHIPDHINKRWACIKLLERDEMLLEAYDISGIDSLPAVDEQIANEKYRLINDMMETVVKRPDESYDKLSAKLDKYILNQWIGIPIFALVMYFVFNMTFTLGDMVWIYWTSFFPIMLQALRVPCSCRLVWRTGCSPLS